MIQSTVRFEALTALISKRSFVVDITTENGSSKIRKYSPNYLAENPPEDVRSPLKKKENNGIRFFSRVSMIFLMDFYLVSLPPASCVLPPAFCTGSFRKSAPNRLVRHD